MESFRSWCNVLLHSWFTKKQKKYMMKSVILFLQNLQTIQSFFKIGHMQLSSFSLFALISSCFLEVTMNAGTTFNVFYPNSRKGYSPFTKTMPHYIIINLWQTGLIDKMLKITYQLWCFCHLPQIAMLSMLMPMKHSFCSKWLFYGHCWRWLVNGIWFLSVSNELNSINFLTVCI